MKIVFMGTPDFAVISLDILINNNFDVVAVITAPDKPAGRGRQLQQSPVKQFAIQNDLNVLQPTNLKDTAFIEELRNLNADLFIVVAFRMLPEAVWNMPPKGTFNLHASLLPRYRGAAPINWAIINGEKETGVTTFFLKQEIDTGEIIFQEKTFIDTKETAGDLHDRLMETGAKLVLKTAKAIKVGNISTTPQEKLINSEIETAPKIFREDCKINWNNSSKEIYNLIRGLSPYPSAWSILSMNGKEFNAKIFFAEHCADFDAQPGQINSNNKDHIRVKTSDSALCITEIQLEGKKKLKVEEFLRGTEIPEGSFFS
ncbi:MAG: methionyl-tRNA formyltransferase [Nitrosopumilus sp.]|nr:methionyl-tRNA formyltransferase [Nitrosopumilus sp.]